MKTRHTLPGGIAAALMLAAAYPAFAADKPAAKKDDLQGSWNSKLDGDPMKLTSSNGNFTTMVLTKKLMSGTYTVDAKKSPKHLDLVIKDGEAKVIGKRILCIYEVTGKKLKWCANDPVKENPRPKTFPDKQGEKGHYVFLIFDRLKKADKQDARGEAKTSDRARLQGDWKMVSATLGGKPVSKEALRTRLNIEENEFTLIGTGPNGKQMKSKSRIKLNAAKSPRQIDFVRNGRVETHGIYKLEGKRLTICIDHATQARPTKLESRPESECRLLVFERASDLDRLQGEWKLVAGKRRGKAAPPDGPTITLAVRGDTFTLKTGKRDEATRVRLHPEKSPKQIDFVDKNGKVTSLGIYKLEGNKATFCFDERVRPATFESKTGTHVTLFVFRAFEVSPRSRQPQR